MKRSFLIFTFILSLALTGSIKADQIFGDFKRLPDEIERGFSTSGDIGVFVLTGQPRTATNPGFQLALNLGVDILPFLGIEAINVFGIHEADPFDAALQGGVNTYLHELAIKLQYPIKRWHPMLEFGGGIFHSIPDFKFDNDPFKWTMLGAVGIEYYTYLRHYSLYIKSIYHVILDSQFNALSVSAGIRYTF